MLEGPNELSKTSNNSNDPNDLARIIGMYFAGLNELYRDQILKLLGVKSLEELSGRDPNKILSVLKDGVSKGEQKIGSSVLIAVELIKSSNGTKQP